MTCLECEGTGQNSDQEREHISNSFPFTDTERIVKIEILISDKHLHQVVQIIRNNARTGYRGDGMIMLSPVDEVYKVRTDDQGHLAIF